MKLDPNRLPALFSNAVVIVSSAVIAVLFATNAAGSDDSFSAFHYFTTLSNLFAAAAALPLCAVLLRWDPGPLRLPAWIRTLRFIGTAVLLLTMTTVFLFLAPLYRFMPSLFLGVNFFFHIVNPVLSLCSFLFWEDAEPVPMRTVLLSLAPVLCYGAVYFVEVIVLGPDAGGWHDFYGFNLGGRWYFILPAVTACALGLFCLLRLLRNRSVRARRVGESSEKPGGSGPIPG